MRSHWQPSCSQQLLKQRAWLLQQIRSFFAERDVLEVETPLLCQGIGTDPQLAFFSCDYELPPHQQALYLQTSPEFTLLEWYRVGFDLQQLMDEVEALISALFAGYDLGPTTRLSYQDAFLSHTGLDPFAFNFDQYQAYSETNGLPEAAALCGEDAALWLDLLFSHLVQPQLGSDGLAMVHGYPACQASLARLSHDNPQSTERVEIFINGIELGNGYHELADPIEQERRFDGDIAIRRQRGQSEVKKDHRLLAALASGLPDCSGMAIGLDRLLMLLSDSLSIKDVLAFPIGDA